MGKGNSKVKWSLNETKVNNDSFRMDVVSLERSTTEDRKKNLVGLPEDIIAMVAVYVARQDITDMGVVAQVCKTWRRISYSPNVWKAIARERKIELKEDSEESFRVQVLSDVQTSKQKYFWLPHRALRQSLIASPSTTHKVSHTLEFSVFLMSRNDQTGRAGKTSLATRFTQHYFRSLFDPEIVVTKAQEVAPNIKVAVSDPDSLEFGHLYEGKVRQCDCLVYCDTFEQENSLEHLMKFRKRFILVKDVDDVTHEDDGMPLFVVARTMSDLKNDFVQKRGVLDFCQHYKLPFYSCSAKTGLNVNKMFHDIGKILAARIKQNLPK